MDQESRQKHGTALLRRLQCHIATMAPHQKDRYAGCLLLEATDEIGRLIGICEQVHDWMLRGYLESTLRRKLEEGWHGPDLPAERDRGSRIALLEHALADCISTYRNDGATVIVTPERQEAWEAALRGNWLS